MFGTNLAVDRELEDPRQPEGTCNVETRAGRGQVLNGTCKLLPGRAELDHLAPVGRYARVLPALVQCLWICHLCPLCGSAIACLARKRARQHISARTFARVTDKRVALHVADDRMRRDRNMDHFSPALRTEGGVVFWIQSRHRLSRLKTCPEKAGVYSERCFFEK